MLKLKYAKDFSVIGVLTCDHCGLVTEHNLSEKRAGDSILCPCGRGFLLSDDTFREAREILRDFKKFVQGLSQ